MSDKAKKELPPAEAHDSETQQTIDTLLQQAYKVDFPGNPPIDKDGNPKYAKIDEELRLQPLNDLGNAQRLLRRFGDRLIYVENIGWHGWTGTHWSRDDGDRQAERISYDTAAALKKELLAVITAGPSIIETEKAFKKRVDSFRKFANGTGNANRMKAMRETAQTFLSRRHDQLDQNPFLVTVENGTLVLDHEDDEKRINIFLRGHKPEDLISKKMPVKYDANAKCPKFERALAEIVPDSEIRKFLQRYYGYCLTGSVMESVIMMLYGQGSNGKSLIMGLMNFIFGDYAQNIPISSIMAQERKSGSGATPDLARLPGARFVTASEPETGERFSESLLKLVTGGEMMVVRHLNEGFFEFMPQFKLCISFNNKPMVRGADAGFWRRVLLVPFNERFYNEGDPNYLPGDKPKNINLRDELKEEASGILNWLIDGYYMWRADGLQVPDKVKAATEEYRAETNHVLQFVQSWCELGDGYSISSTKLYEAYAVWAKEASYEPHTKTLFGKKVAELPKVKRERGAATNYYFGLRLNHEGELAVQGESRKSVVDTGGDAI